MKTPSSLDLGTGLVLTAVAGFVDAVGFLELGGFFASFMSGASITLGISASEHEWGAFQHAGALVASFVVAATIGSLLSEIRRPWGTPAVIALEAICLSGAIVMVLRGWPSSAAVFPAVAAMGIQNTALHSINGVRLGVTFMTGTLVSLSRAIGSSILGHARPFAWAPHALVWCAFIAGAAAGALLHTDHGFVAFLVPTATLWLLVIFTIVAGALGLHRHRRSSGQAG